MIFFRKRFRDIYCKIRDAESAIENLQDRLWEIECPPKCKIGDEVSWYGSTEDNVGEVLQIFKHSYFKRMWAYRILTKNKRLIELSQQEVYKTLP